MGVRFGLARAVAAVSTWGLRHVFRRPAANFPGKVALYVDPALVAHLAPRVDASICVVGTNGKTTVTNLLADAFEAAGAQVVCNRTGANLDSGVTTALLHAGQAPNRHPREAPDESTGRAIPVGARSGAPDARAGSSASLTWGVFECDELWLAKILPGLQSRFVLLLNLFRDQLDRVGEIDHIQESIAEALAASPETVLIYNADDPLCQAIADRVANPCAPFGLEGDLGLPANTVADARMCQRCSTMLEYDRRHYGQLGAFHCPNCGFSRIAPEYVGHVTEKGKVALDGHVIDYGASSYMAYNLLAVWAACDAAGVPFDALERAVAAFDPHNGRLERYSIGGRDVLLNLAKNPTGFNQNLNIVLDGAAAAASAARDSALRVENRGITDAKRAGSSSRSTISHVDDSAAGTGNSAVAFYINDKEADGRDVSWLWDIDFQNLAGAVEAGDLRVYAGGIRRNDMQVRLKYAGVPADLVDGVDDFLARVPEDGNGYVIANYTALPGVKAALDKLQDSPAAALGRLQDDPAGTPDKPQDDPVEILGRPQDDPVEILGRPQDDPVGAPFKASALPGKTDVLKSPPAKTRRPEPCGTPSPSVAPLTIAHLFPTLLNLYGDNGNVTVLAQRARWRGIDARVVEVDEGNMRELDWDAVDIVFLGGGPDREQHLAAEFLAEMAGDLRAFVESNGVMLAICGGFQIIGREWLMGDETVPGLGILGMTTQRAEGGSHNRLVGNITLESPLAPTMKVVGYENHAGRTFLDEGVEPFGRVAGSHGHGNNDRDHADGALYRNVVGTYLHGPLLAKNPEVADELLRRALARRTGRPVELPALDDSEEREANLYMRERLGT